VELLTPKVEGMLDFLLWVEQRDGTIPVIGDNYETRVFSLNSRPPNDIRNLLALGALLFSRGDFKYGSRGEVEDLIWLFGREGLERFQAIPSRTPSETFKAFQTGGYFVIRDSWELESSHLILDCGYIGLGKPRRHAATHGHSDILSFTLSIDGIPFIVDIGCYTYTGSKDWHDYFRSTAGHNTVTVDGRDQCGRLLSTWEVERQPEIVEKRLERGNDETVSIYGSHDGYALDGDPLLHHRRVIRKRHPRRWEIIDTFNNYKSHFFDVRLHFHPEIEVLFIQSHPERGGSLTATHRNRYFELAMEFVCTDLSDGKDVPLSLTNEESWYSEHYGQKKQCMAFKVSWQADFPNVLKTTIIEQSDRARCANSLLP
jgi:hypothetical protein